MKETVFKNRVNLFIFSFILFSIGSVCISFFPPNEPQYADAALRMIETGNYIIPFFNCHVRFDKPILYYLELVIPFKMFFVDELIKSGHDPLCIIEYAARLPSIIASSFIMILTYSLSNNFFKDKNISINSVIALLSFFFYFYLTRAVYPDASLILFEFAAIYFFIKNRYIIAWIFVALGFLTKGPIGIVLPGFTYFIYLWVVEQKSGIKELFSTKNIFGFIVFLIISTPWYITMYNQYGMEFINKFLIYHNIERFTGKAHQHPHSFFYYIPVILVVSYMWIGYSKQLIDKINIKDKNNLFLLLWAGWIILFFSISKNKLAHYIAPSFIPIAILFGRYMETLKNTKRIQIGMFIFEILLGIGLSIYAYIAHLIYLIPTALFGLFFMALINFTESTDRMFFKKVIAFHIIASIILMQFEMYRPEKRIWKAVVNNTISLYEYKIRNNTLVAYTRSCLKPINNLKELQRLPKPFYLYTRVKYIKELSLFKHKTILFYARDKGKNAVFMLIDG